MSSRTRGRLLRRLLVPLIALSMLVAGCGGADDGGANGGSGTTQLTALIPFPSGISFYPLFVAQERGYFGENVSLRIEVADGTAASLQQVLTGQADLCLCSPGPVLRAIAGGEDLTSVYTLYQSDVFALVVPSSKPIGSVEELRGKTVGVDTRQAGAESWLVPLLKKAGLELDKDYQITAVGSGASPIAAFERGEIAAYAAAYVDVSTMELRGYQLTKVNVPGSEVFFDSAVWMKSDFVKNNPDVVRALGRGLAMATQWGQNNPDGVLEITGKKFAEEVSDMEFARALLEDTEALWQLPASANGQWGYTDPNRAKALIDALVEQGYLEKPVDASVFSNQFVADFNAFEESAL